MAIRRRSWMLILLAFLGSKESMAESRLSLRSYGEFVSLEEERGFASSAWIKGRYECTEGFFAVLGVQRDSYQPKVGSIRRASPFVGLEKNFGALTAFASYRYDFENPALPYPKNDPRLGITGGYWAQSTEQSSHNFFSDTYGELISVPRIQWKPNFLLFSKVGWRESFAKNLYTDPYLELYSNQTADPALGRNALEGRGGLRFVYARDHWSGSAALFYRLFSLRNAPAPRLRFQFAMGAQF